jgi:sirohydrochlorin cobaltochelatase
VTGKTALLIVGHGSREPRANAGFEGFVRDYAVHARGSQPDLTVSHAYVELAQPSLDQALAELGPTHDRVIVVPLFLFLVGHTKNDVPIALARARAAFPGKSFIATRELGVHGTMLDIAFDRAAAAMPLGDGAAAGTVAVVVGRGSSDPDANGEFYKLARLFGEGRGFHSVLPTFIGITKPLLPETLDLVGRMRPDRLVVVPYFLFDGKLADKLRAQTAEFCSHYPWIRTAVAAPLGPDMRLFQLVDERVTGALAGQGPLPCDTCHFRAPVAGVVNAVGGMKALLYSLRHGFTHTQAAPHPHAHRALTKHVLVCGNADCADRGSIALLEGLRQRVRDAERQKDIRITRTSCMGRCGEGPTVAVYPDGIWYRGVSPQDAEVLMREHLLGDRIVAHLVDNIMQ